MNPREAAILHPEHSHQAVSAVTGPAGIGKSRTHRGTRAWLIVAATIAISPSAALCQIGHLGPAVVPPAAAYIGSSDGSSEVPLPRWEIGTEGPRTLWVYFAPAPPGHPDFWVATARAMATWNEVSGVPLSFRRTAHREGADVEFRWIRRFEARQAGTTDWKTDGEGWLRTAVVTLALEHEDGTAMSNEFRGLVSLHELGHVIGLPHSEEPTDVMHPGNRRLELSDRDILSARQLYMRPGTEKVVIP